MASMQPGTRQRREAGTRNRVAAALAAGIMLGVGFAAAAQTKGQPPVGASARSEASTALNCKTGEKADGGAACSKVPAPADAYATGDSYGRGWECRHGFVRDDERCVAIQVPPHGYLTGSEYDGGWECDRGYRKAAGVCALIEVPANAYLNESTFGSGWQCEPGYQLAGSSCERVKLPQHAYAIDSSYGRAWECMRGYRRTGETCASVLVPVNAYLETSGRDFKYATPASCSLGVGKRL